MGVLSRLDLLRAYVRTDELWCSSMCSTGLDGYAGGGRVWSVTVCDGAAEIVGQFSDQVERTVVEALARYGCRRGSGSP